MQRFIERGMTRDPEQSAPEGNLPSRIDIGSSLVNRARGGLAVSDDPAENKDAFLEHSASTHEFFSHLFDGFDNPVDTLYDCLSALAVNKEVKVAREPDGRLYGPAIFRIHYEGHEYVPHVNHVALDDKLFNYEVSRFTHQLRDSFVYKTPPMMDSVPKLLYIGAFGVRRCTPISRLAPITNTLHKTR